MMVSDGKWKRCCCGCCSVRTGTIIIGVIWLILNTLHASLYAGYLVILIAGDEGHEDLDTHPRMLVDKDEFKYQRLDLQTNLRRNDFYQKYREVFILILFLCFNCSMVNAILSGLMLHGATKNGPARQLVPWLCFNAVCLIISVICSFLATLFIIFKFGSVHGFTIMLALTAVYYVYMYLYRVVYYYIQELKCKEQAEIGFDGVAFVGHHKA